MDLGDVLRSPDLQGIFGLEIVHQTYPHACACACVTTILRNLGMYASERMVVDALTPNPVIGVKPPAIVEYLAKKGLMVSALRHYPAEMILSRVQAGKLSMLRRNDRGDHWVVPVAVEPLMGVVVIADPSLPDSTQPAPYTTALTGMTTDEFTASWGRKDVIVTVNRPSTAMAKLGAQKRRSFVIQYYDTRPAPEQRVPATR